jgi:hypothetical protein
MTRIERLRDYRRLFTTEITASVNKHVASGTRPSPEEELWTERMRQRVRLINAELDKLEAIRYGRKEAQREVPLEFQTA